MATRWNIRLLMGKFLSYKLDDAIEYGQWWLYRRGKRTDLVET